jgi:hypothetical protein
MPRFGFSRLIILWGKILKFNLNHLNLTLSLNGAFKRRPRLSPGEETLLSGSAASGNQNGHRELGGATRLTFGLTAYLLVFRPIFALAEIESA